MVRFKNRYLLVEFLIPSSFSSNIQNNHQNEEEFMNLEEEENNILNDEDDGEDEEDEEDLDYTLKLIPKIPFLLPKYQTLLEIGDENISQQIIYKSIKGIIQDIFGDEGWSRVSSSFRVIYHSTLTTLTFIKIARPYYRLIWSSLTFLTTLSSGNNNNSKNLKIIPRVIGISGTIKKMQNLGITYHRLIIAQLINHSSSIEQNQENTIMRLSGVGNDKVKLQKESDREREEIGRLDEV
ncbi:uncharacterized protein I206_100381 [Kwoniella pini CBS 10737]|uniref:Ribonuclease P/MRP protein subunit POP5 n=1 Tax=Kwoniella pini CBS 10737 TaxID=1296096 RepID=A0A1B9IDR0_9TREE|nr:uncharacterized protein I206_00943 [Kwoniella pini CBS 10737]OCF53637.1 hypothetical protein I206_00943 [Kwoniella pini CBS 10737]